MVTLRRCWGTDLGAFCRGNREAEKKVACQCLMDLGPLKAVE